MNKLEKERGITLIALIITIIILVILAAVSIRAVTNMKIVDYAVNGSQNYAKAGKNENKILEDTTSFIDEAVAKVEDAQNGKIDITKKTWKNFNDDLDVNILRFSKNGTFTDQMGFVGTYQYDGETITLTYNSGYTEQYKYNGESFVGEFEDDGGINHTMTLIEFAVEKISFTVDNVKYTAEKDMDWRVWINTDYNTDGFYAADVMGYVQNKQIATLGKIPIAATTPPTSLPRAICTADGSPIYDYLGMICETNVIEENGIYSTTQPDA